MALLKTTAQKVLPRSWYAILRRCWHRLRLACYRPHLVQHTYGNVPLRLWIADPLAAGWYDHDWTEPPEVGVLREGRLRPGDRVFDLGAHQCLVALLLGRIVGPAGTVIAVEGSAHNAAIGRRNCRLNPPAPIEIVHAVVSDHSGEEVFNLGLNGHVDHPGNEWGRQRVPAITLDELTARYGAPAAILVDVEGFECRVLAGARATLQTCPDWVIEVHTGVGLEDLGGSVEELLGFFPPQYRLFAMPMEAVRSWPFAKEVPCRANASSWWHRPAVTWG